MAHCFQLISTETKSVETFATIDDKMCEHFGVRPSKSDFFHNWYNVIGMLMASGMTFDEIIKCCKEHLHGDQTILNIINWLKQNYTISAWREVRKV